MIKILGRVFKCDSTFSQSQFIRNESFAVLAWIVAVHKIQSAAALPTLLYNLSVWPDWAIYYTLVNFLKPLATINLFKLPTFLGNFCKGVKAFNFSNEIIFGQLL